MSPLPVYEDHMNFVSHVLILFCVLVVVICITYVDQYNQSVLGHYMAQSVGSERIGREMLCNLHWVRY